VTLNFPKTLMVLLICLAFVGQAVASTMMSYQMMSMMGISSQQQVKSMPEMQHSGHHMATDSAAEESESSTKDCCSKTCSCFTGSCSSIAMLVKSMNTGATVDLSPKINSIVSLALSQQSSSLYRPPILS
jgi:hypothetical protein